MPMTVELGYSYLADSLNLGKIFTINLFYSCPVLFWDFISTASVSSSFSSQCPLRFAFGLGSEVWSLYFGLRLRRAVFSVVLAVVLGLPGTPRSRTLQLSSPDGRRWLRIGSLARAPPSRREETGTPGKSPGEPNAGQASEAVILFHSSSFPSPVRAEKKQMTFPRKRGMTFMLFFWRARSSWESLSALVRTIRDGIW
jgi:hypothetical protein